MILTIGCCRYWVPIVRSVAVNTSGSSRAVGGRSRFDPLLPVVRHRSGRCGLRWAANSRPSIELIYATSPELQYASRNWHRLKPWMTHGEAKILQIPKTERVVCAVPRGQQFDQVKMIRDCLARRALEDGPASDMGHDGLRHMCIGPRRRSVCFDHARRQEEESGSVDRAEP